MRKERQQKWLPTWWAFFCEKGNSNESDLLQGTEILQKLFFFVLGHNLFRPREKFVREREKKFFETEILLKG